MVQECCHGGAGVVYPGGVGRAVCTRALLPLPSVPPCTAPCLYYPAQCTTLLWCTEMVHHSRCPWQESGVLVGCPLQARVSRTE